MSVDVFATNEHRSGSLPCRESGEGGPQSVVMIRVGGRTFTSECRDMQEATEVAQHIAAEFAKHYGRS